MPAPKRPNYFQSQFLIVRDFQDEQTYHDVMLRRHNLLMHDWGVVRDGLKVNKDGNDYFITRGSAIDSLGREIVLDDDPNSGPPAGKVNQADVAAAQAAAGAGQDVLITITFNEIGSNDPLDQYPPKGGTENVTRKVQSPVIAVTKAPAPAEAVILASVKGDGSVDYSTRKPASGFVRVGDSNDLFIGPGRNLGIGTTGAPAATLHLGSGSLQIGTAPTSVTTIDTRITHTFNDETTPRYTIDRDLLGNGLAGIGFNTRKVPTSATLAANGSAVGIPADRALAFSTSDGTSLVERMRIDGTGNVSITRNLNVTGALSVGDGINLNNKPLTLRADNSGPDINHGLGYFGAGASTMGDFAMDGPVLYGSHSGALGTYGAKKVALRWDDSGNVGIGKIAPGAKLMVSGTDSTTAIETKEVLRLLRPGVASTKNNNSAGFLVGACEAGISGKARLDIAVSSAPVDTNGWGSVPDLTVMSLQGNGKVGIGTTSPAETLTVGNSTAGGNYAQDAQAGWRESYKLLRGSAQKAAIGTDATGAKLQLFTGATTDDTTARLTVDSSGNVGIGTNNPQDKLTINGGAISFQRPDNPVPYAGLDYDDKSDMLRFLTNVGTNVLNTTPMVIDRQSGFVGIGTQDPSAGLTLKAGPRRFTPSSKGGCGGDAFVWAERDVPWVPSINVGDDVILNNERRRVIAVPTDKNFQVDRAFPRTPSMPITVIRNAESGDILRADDKAGNPKFLISGNGNLGLGTTYPSAKLSVQQGTAINADQARMMANQQKNGLVLDLNFSAWDAGKLLDLSGNGNSARIVGNVQVIPDVMLRDSLNCARFTGGYCSVGDLNLNFLGGGLTIEVWVCFKTFTDWARIIDFGNGPDADNIFLTTLEGGKPYFSVYRGGTAVGNMKSPIVLKPNVWTHLAVTLDVAGFGGMYIDGKMVVRPQDQQFSLLPQNAIRQNNYIGKSNWPDPAFNGLISSLRIYNRFLTVDEINADRNNDSRAPGATPEVTADMIKKYSDGKAIFVCTDTGDGRTLNGSIELRDSSLMQGIGLGHNTIYAAGYIPSQDLTIQSKGRGSLNLNPLDGSGNVGIGTNIPTQAKLVVNGSAVGTFRPYGYLSVAGTAANYGSTSTDGSQNVPISIYASHRVAALEFNAFSDQRIKTIHGPSDSAMDLCTLLSIEVTDFRYKDVIGKGDALHKKVIAQQVEKVFPQAVSKHTDVVPDIYRPASLTDGWIKLTTDLKKGERVKLINEKGEEAVHEVLEVTPEKFRVDFNFEGDQVFVFGREVDDFLAVDYEAISMLNVSGTQQLKKEVETLRTEIAELKLVNDAVMKLQVLDRKEATAPSLVVAKNGSNGNGRH